jgi:hypothetical protein
MPCYRTPAQVVPAPPHTRVLDCMPRLLSYLPKQRRARGAQMRTITLEDKENASPQLAQTPETSLPAKTTNPMAAKPTASPLVRIASGELGGRDACCRQPVHALRMLWLACVGHSPDLIRAPRGAGHQLCFVAVRLLCLRVGGVCSHSVACAGQRPASRARWRGMSTRSIYIDPTAVCMHLCIHALRGLPCARCAAACFSWGLF